MKKIIRREIQIREEQFIARIKSSNTNKRYCTECGNGSQMVSPVKAAAALGLGTRLIYRLLEMEKIHFEESQAKVVLVCITSLLNYIAGSDETETEKEIKRIKK